ncbi:uncharacterized protein [Physcomitrium patens]|nr:uncharacterized protein LOC112296110 isoform X2 [Physcomitrium patens]|eukprot:XP_024404056.1 uncharacterized protein LOC112296110 isoform X2 [Physcomitrella patens]
MSNKSTNSKFIGFEELPKAAKTYFEKIYERNTQRLLSYGKDETTILQLKPINSTKKLENVYNLDHDPQVKMEKGATVQVSEIPVNEKLSLKRFQENEPISQLLSEVNNAHEVQPKPRQRSHKDKILRNMKLGPDARYFKLTEEQEAFVEQILAQPDVDNILNEECSVASFTSTGYDFDDEDAKRIAQINVELDQLQHQTHNPITSSRGESSRVPSVSTKQGMDTARTEKCSKPSTNKFHDMMSISNSANTSDMRVKHYLEDQRVRREGQERIEEINKTLGELERMEFPKLTAQELDALILQCKYEQGIVSTDPSQSTIQEEHELVPKSLHQCDPLVIKFQDHLRVEASGTVHSNQHNAASLVQNHLATTSRVQPRPRVPAPA